MDVAVDNWKVGEEIFSLRYRRSTEGVRVEISRRTNSAYKLVFGPAFGLGTKVHGVTANGRAVKHRLAAESLGQAVQPLVEVALGRNDVIEIQLGPVPELLPPANESQTGDTSQGLRIIRSEFKDGKLKTVLEGLAGRTYPIRVVRADLIRSVSGAKQEGAVLRVQIPPGPPGEYVRHELVIGIK
jgi:hypothetical protein